MAHMVMLKEDVCINMCWSVIYKEKFEVHLGTWEVDSENR